MKKINKIVILTLIVCSTLLLTTGCKRKYNKTNLVDLMAEVYENIYAEDIPVLKNINVLQDSPDNVAYYIGAKNIEYTEILASEPMMSSVAHSVVLIRMKKGSDIEEAKERIKDKINPRKWNFAEISRDDIIVKNKGNLIILIMVADEVVREKIEQGFDNL